MIVERSMHAGYLSNTWLVGDREGGAAVLIDSGGPLEPLIEIVERERLSVGHLLCTHHHIDHICGNHAARGRFDCRIVSHELERDRIGHVDRLLGDGETLQAGELTIRALHVPGHTAGQLAFVVNEERVFTGDTLFRHTVGGTRAPGHTTLDDLRHSVMEVLMGLPSDWPVHPGHMESSSIGEEWQRNPFIRVWRGLDPPDDQPCTAGGRAATLLLRAADYDGGTKCWVRFDDGEEAIVGGSQVRD